MLSVHILSIRLDSRTPASADAVSAHSTFDQAAQRAGALNPHSWQNLRFAEAGEAAWTATTDDGAEFVIRCITVEE